MRKEWVGRKRNGRKGRKSAWKKEEVHVWGGREWRKTTGRGEENGVERKSKGKEIGRRGK